jgi:RNA-directed DNA polymerase
MNNPALALFRFRVGWLWHRALSRRSQNGRVLWNRMRRLIARWLPLPIVCHPYPLRRMGVVTLGKSRMREIRLSGSDPRRGL